MSVLTGVRDAYRHEAKLITTGPRLSLGDRALLKWYDVAPQRAPVPDEIGALARRNLEDAFATETLDVSGLGFVILHRCGEAFYFLLVSTWAGDNELWETVLAKSGQADSAFRPWPRPGTHVPTFCVWELGAVWSEQQAWSRFLRSPRSEVDVQAYLDDSFEGAV